jgi:hypothetical protein
VLQELVEVAPTLDYVTHNHVEEHVEGRASREITLYVYADAEIEREHAGA